MRFRARPEREFEGGAAGKEGGAHLVHGTDDSPALQTLQEGAPQALVELADEFPSRGVKQAAAEVVLGHRDILLRGWRGMGKRRVLHYRANSGVILRLVAVYRYVSDLWPYHV